MDNQYFPFQSLVGYYMDICGIGMITIKIKYSDFTECGGIAEYAITIKGESFQSIKRAFYKQIPTAWDAVFLEVTEC
tara:strand:- start:132 stop:362 length:231 start_codon:yes stop_codon:yes gene_type:complete